MSTTVSKDKARQIINDLPDGATWDDLMYRLYVVECIEQGRADCKAGRVTSNSDVRKEFGLS